MKRRSLKRVNVKKENKPFKTLAVATIAGLSIIGVGQAQAVTLNEVDLSQKPIDAPTLDHLKNNNVLIPQTKYDDNKNLVEDTPIESPGSGYTYTKVDAKGDNTVTKFEYDKTTGAMVPVYYRVDLKQTTYGDGNQSKTYTVNGINGGTYDITAKYNDSYTTEYKDHKYEATVTSSGTEIHSALQNPSGKTITIKDAVFENNSTAINYESSSYRSLSVYGGALYNAGEITGITADFINNSVTATGYPDASAAHAYGGALYNAGTIGDITGDFIGNSATGYAAYGGAIANAGTIGNITGYFIGNSGKSGGAIFNGRTICNITGDFIGNSASMYGGAIFNSGGTIGNITGDFIGNSTDDRGGAIFNSGGTIGNITGDFIGNSAADLGGAIEISSGTIGNITGDFIGNSAAKWGGAIYNQARIGSITGDFIGNSTTGSGGAIQNHWTIGSITGNFIGNSAGCGAIYNGNSGTIGSITGDFIGNSATGSNYAQGGAIYNDSGSTISDITGDFIGNSATGSNYAQGGAIYNALYYSNWWGSKGSAIIGNITGNFIGNYAKSETGEAKGGAIYSPSDLSLVADNRTNTFKDNYTESQGVKDDNAIYIDDNATLNFTMKNNGKIYMADNIDGTVRKDSDGNITGTYSVNIQGDNINNTTFYMLNDIRNANVTFDNTTINAVNNQTHVYNFNTLTVNSDTNFVADVDLANAQMDRITATNYGTHQGKLNVVGMNLLSDATKDVTEIYFAEQGLKDNVVNGMPANGGYNLPSSAQTTFYTPIYKYNAIYDNRDDGGYFVFDRVSAGNNSGNASDNFNPSVLAPSVASQAGANATMNQTFNYAFQNSDNFMTIPYLERIAIKTSNRYALSPTGDATDVGTFSPLFNTMNETSSAWVKPYASFENIPLKNGPKVSNITYGTLVGFDTPIKSIKHGWDRAWTGYIGYNGASQRFSGVDATQNGGLVGGTLTLYKGNFFNATTVSSGAIVGDNRTMYGTDNYTMLMAGVGNKTGYNFEFKEGKIIIQPSMLLSYTFVNTFDYTNAAGVKIKNDPLHAIQIAPGVKFIANTKNGWQPYIGVNMIWNLLDKSKVSANDVRLPEMSIKPYVQYGVGVQKRFKDRYMAFGQAMIQNGGRNGISLTAGFRWAIGKEGKPLEKVQRVNNKVSSVTPRAEVKVANNSTVQPERKIIKQLSQTQRERIAKQYQNTTRTTSIGTLKQL